MKGKNYTKLHEFQKRHRGKTEQCPRCKRMAPMTVDHIIPQSLLQQLGYHDAVYNDEENFEAMCQTCNSFKASRIDLANPKTVPLLKKYVGGL